MLVLFLIGSSHVAIKLFAIGRQLLPAIGNDLGQTVTQRYCVNGVRIHLFCRDSAKLHTARTL
jgi:hypothetical protein